MLFVDSAGRLVSQRTLMAPVATTPTVDTFIRTLDSDRYRLIEKKDEKEVYRDKETGTKWVVKVERDDD